MTVPARILVVDDERFFREGIRDVLEARGLSCITAATGGEALELASTSDVGVVVLDLVLPGLDGIEVLRRLRERQPGLRVIMLSAYTEQERVLEALRLGAFEYLAKPIHDEELVLVVRRALESHALGRELAGLQARAEQLARSIDDLAELAQADVDEPERRAVLHARAAAAVAEVLDADKTSLLLVQDDGARLQVVAATGRKQAPDEFDAVALGRGVAGMATARSEVIAVGDVTADARFTPGPPGRYASKAFVVAPIPGAGRTLGVLCATDRPGGHPFQPSDVALLRILARQLGSLLDHGPIAAPAPAGVGASRDGDLSELVRRICDASAAEVEPRRLLAAVLQPIAAAFSAAPVSLYLCDPASGDLVREAECDGAFRGDRPLLPRGRGLTGSVLETGRLVASDSPQADPRFDAAVDTPDGGAAGPLLCLPLTFRGKVLGVARIFPREPDRASARAGEVLAAALSAAVRNVMLYRSLVESIEEVANARREAQAS